MGRKKRQAKAPLLTPTVVNFLFSEYIFFIIILQDFQCPRILNDFLFVCFCCIINGVSCSEAILIHNLSLFVIGIQGMEALVRVCVRACMCTGILFPHKEQATSSMMWQRQGLVQVLFNTYAVSTK